MKKLPALLCALFVAAGLVAAAPAQAETRPRVLVIGDSVTSMYNDKTGDELRGWWSFLSESLDLTIVRSARSGAGFLKYGENCTKGRFGSYLDHVNQVRPDAIIVAGGSNDMHKCAGTKRLTATTAEASAATKAYMQALRKRVDQIKLSPAKVYVFVPWGSKYQEALPQTRQTVKYWAVKNGFTFVPVGGLPRSATFADHPGRLDAIHPNEIGSAYFARQVIANSDIGKRVAKR